MLKIADYDLWTSLAKTLSNGSKNRVKTLKANLSHQKIMFIVGVELSDGVFYYL